MINDALPNEVTSILLSNLDKWLSLESLGKVVHHHNKKFSLSSGCGKGSRMSIPY